MTTESIILFQMNNKFQIELEDIYCLISDAKQGFLRFTSWNLFFQFLAKFGCRFPKQFAKNESNKIRLVISKSLDNLSKSPSTIMFSGLNMHRLNNTKG
jgi:hypothetical protein